jgi:hypothetical protein
MSKWKALRETFKRILSWLATRPILIGALVFALILAPIGAHAQFGLDPCCAIISAGLNTVSGLLKNVVGRPLTSIQQIQQQTANFEQQVVWPADAINRARGLAGQMQGQFKLIQQIHNLPISSATLTTPQQLEQSLLSRDPNQMSQITRSYSAVYGPVMGPSDATQPVRDLVDMSDAESQAALKKAVELDALADVELAAADQINRQIQNAAPGTAPLLEAQAATWVVRANAYTQSAMAELVRVRSIDLANAGAELKLNAVHTTTLRNTAGQALGRGVR